MTNDSLNQKTETLSLHLDPKLAYGLELLCRKTGKNKSDMLRWIIDRAIADDSSEKQREISDNGILNIIDKVLQTKCTYGSYKSDMGDVEITALANNMAYYITEAIRPHLRTTEPNEIPDYMKERSGITGYKPMEPVIVSLKKCTHAIDNIVMSATGKFGDVSTKDCQQWAKAVLDAAGVKYGA